MQSRKLSNRLLELSHGQTLLYSEFAYTAWVQTNSDALFDAIRDDREVVHTLRQLQERAAEVLMVD